MYTLMLTYDERRAIDFVGHRYPEGDGLWSLLWLQSEHPVQPDGEYVEWDGQDDIAFSMPEHIAWAVRDLLESEDSNYGAALFSRAFREKLMAFCAEIV